MVYIDKFVEFPKRNHIIGRASDRRRRVTNTNDSDLFASRLSQSEHITQLFDALGLEVELRTTRVRVGPVLKVLVFNASQCWSRCHLFV